MGRVFFALSTYSIEGPLYSNRRHEWIYFEYIEYVLEFMVVRSMFLLRLSPNKKAKSMSNLNKLFFVTASPAVVISNEREKTENRTWRVYIVVHNTSADIQQIVLHLLYPTLFLSPVLSVSKISIPLLLLSVLFFGVVVNFVSFFFACSGRSKTTQNKLLPVPQLTNECLRCVCMYVPPYLLVLLI